MQKYSIALCLIITALLAAGCQMTPKIDLEAEKAALLESDRAFSAFSVGNGAASAFQKYLAEDAIQFPSNGKPIHGNQAIFDAMIDGADCYTLKWEPQHAEVSATADLGWTWGRWTLAPADTSQSEQHGHYLNVWKKMDGSWRVLADIGSND
ncbi:nuclear transport factor 2 family protein [bacterium]|nr:nuclear transport factor 2 family protein [bacterium]MBU1650859.1 nuclear transport factor 2 family protein [bacterium]MBU1882262.1 nuclear transport factor 2 family protein [bacterium]